MPTKRRSPSKRTEPSRKKTPAKRREPKVKLITESEADLLGIDDGSKLVKKLAAKQKIDVSLTESQMEKIRSQLKRWDNKKPAEISFLVKGEPKAKFRVAAYGYGKTSCCV